MSTVSIPDLLKAAERPLALFLEDALRHVDPNYWETIVKPYVATAEPRQGYQEYRGQERLVDGRGRAKTSLTECDLQFLTQLFEFAVRDGRRQYDHALKYPELCSVLPLTKSTILSKIAAVRNLRNEWAHEPVHAYDQHDVLIAVAKLNDLYRREIRVCVDAHTAAFRSDTVAALADFESRITAQSAAATVDTPVAGAAQPQHDPVVPPDLQPPAAIPAPQANGPQVHHTTHVSLARTVRRAIPFALAMVLVVTALWSLLSPSKSDDSIGEPGGQTVVPTTRSIMHVIALESTPRFYAKTIAESIQRHMREDKLNSLVVYTDRDPNGREIGWVDDGAFLQRLANELTSMPTLRRKADLFRLWDKSVSSMIADANADVRPRLIVVGSIYDFSNEEWNAINGKVLRFSEGTGKYFAYQEREPVLFYSFAPLTYADSIIRSSLSNRAVPVTSTQFNVQH